jgi:predicted RNase H-like HicB family nuclease
MERQFTLEYWIDDGWYVGKLKEVPGIFSQGESLEELEDNIREAYKLVMQEERTVDGPEIRTKDISVEVS